MKTDTNIDHKVYYIGRDCAMMIYAGGEIRSVEHIIRNKDEMEMLDKYMSNNAR
jgi:hypothetical protein